MNDMILVRKNMNVSAHDTQSFRDLGVAQQII